MAPLIEFLNDWGDRLLTFAVPMLWQSSLLIIVVGALDYLLARKIRAAVRHALWLVVLVKLLLPPALALPTGAAWWLSRSKPAIKVPAIPKTTVTYGPAVAAPEVEPMVAAMPEPIQPRLDRAGWALLASGVVSGILLCWLAGRWWQVTRVVRGALPDDALNEELVAARSLIGSTSRVQLKLVTSRMSPAVCGWFRPVILLPEALAARLSPVQLRAVLLHELMHLRRGDLWVNGAQALLQVAYWWHPLLWVVNARVRRLREEAVDDAVMLALRDDAENYAPTLLEVARLALQRPRLSLGLVGIMESRSALRQRIERLLDFRAPSRAGVTFAAWLGIGIFSAVALPMGEAPARVETAPVAASQQPIVKTTVTAITNLPILVEAIICQAPASAIATLTGTLKSEIRMEREDHASAWMLSADELNEVQDRLEAAGGSRIQSPRVLTGSGHTAVFFTGNNTNSVEFTCLPTALAEEIQLQVSAKLVTQHGRIQMTNAFSVDKRLQNHSGFFVWLTNSNDAQSANMVVLISSSLVTNTAPASTPPSLHKRFAQSTAPSSQGILADPQFQKALAALRADQSQSKSPAEIRTYSGRSINRIELTIPAVQMKTNQPDVVAKSQIQTTPAALVVSNDPPTLTGATNESMRETAADTVSASTAKLAQSATNASAPVAASAGLFTRTFLVDHRAFTEYLEKNGAKLGGGSDFHQLNLSMAAAVQTNFQRLGVDWEKPAGKSISYNSAKSSMDTLLIRATQADLDLIEQTVMDINQAQVTQIHIKAWFLNVPEKEVGKLLGTFNLTNGVTGALDQTNGAAFLKTMRSVVPGVEEEGEPEVTTLSGRQCQMRTTSMITIVTNLILGLVEPQTTNADGTALINATNYPGGTNQNATRTEFIKPQTTSLECGPLVDFVPTFTRKDPRVKLAVLAQDTKFLGYVQQRRNWLGYAYPSTNIVYTLGGDKIKLPEIVPVIQTQRAKATTVLGNGQYLVMFPQALPLDERRLKHIAAAEKKTGAQRLIVVIAATLVDAAGNRL